jgi:hypothetical protein
MTRVIKSIKKRGAGTRARVAEKKNPYMALIETPEWQRPLGRFMIRWKGNIKWNLKKILWENVDWIHVVVSCQNHNKLAGCVKCGNFLKR